MKVLRAADEVDLRNEVIATLKPHCTSVQDADVDTILRDLGALMIDSARDAIASMTADGHASEVLSEVRARLRHLHATLDALGVPDNSDRDVLLKEIAELASAAPIGKHLFAGELFLSMLATETPALIKAFGARTGIQVILDASVAIPMLCTLLYEVVPNRFSISARHVYDQLLTHGQSFVLPVDYLEEVATHLMRAWSDYSEFVDLDRDLANSENSFVSHYVSMKNSGRDIAFSDFVEGFGLDESLRKAEFYVARDRLSRKLQRLFDRYGIKVAPLGTPTRQSFRRAEEGIAYAVRKFGRDRPTVLQKHDARTIAYLHDRDRSNDEADVLCTWDTVHFWMRENEPADWLVMNPAVLGDVFSIARTEDYDGRIFTPVVLASLLSDEASALGALVMDTIARIERGNALDATLIAEAKRFKEDFASRDLADTRASKIGEEWAKWKGQYCERH